MKWFKIYGEKWFMGSTRWELTAEQRSVWIDLLARSSINDPPGHIIYFSLEQLAHQFNVDFKLLESTIKRCVEVKKIKHFPKKNRIVILNWKKYQSEYERQKPYRQQDRCQSKDTKADDNSSNKVTRRREGEERRKDDMRKGEKKEKASSTPKENSQPSPIPSSSKIFPKKDITIKEQFLSMLKNCKGYPFVEEKDALLFDIAIKECSGINIIKQTAKKISWWNNRPDTLKAGPRGQLKKWFAEEKKFKDRGGPQQIGEILESMDDADHRRFIEGFIKEKPKLEKDDSD